MNSDIQAVTDDFLHTLEEVNILLLAAEWYVAEETKYAAYNKSALLLLSGKFENFIEVIAEQYIYLVNGLKLRSRLIPDAMRLYHTLGAIDKIIDYKNAGRFDEVKQLFSNLGSIWVTDVEFGELKIECKFTYGKHGEAELKRLFIPLGIDDIFSQVEVYVPNENTDDTELTKKVDFKGVFNSVMWMRNNILHQNASPSLTHKAIYEYKSAFEIFAQELAKILDTNLALLIKLANQVA